MGSPLLSLLPGVLKAVGKILGIGKLDEAASALENAQISPEKQAELQQALIEQTKALRTLDIEELRTMMTEAIAEIQSPDKYVARARPTGLYIFYVCTAAVVTATILGVKIDPVATLTMLSPLAGVGGLYTYRRTTEKMNGNGTSE